MVKEIKGYVAFLDILGFSNMVRSDTFAHDFETYSNIISKAVDKVESRLQYVTFSDSVVINSTGLSETQLLDLVKAISAVFHGFLTELAVPICGSVSAGNFWRAESKNGDVMIAGLPIVDAYRFEQKQDWVGITLSPKVLCTNSGLLDRVAMPNRFDLEAAKGLLDRLPWPMLVQRHYGIPFHQSSELEQPRYHGLAIVPQSNGCTPEGLTNELKTCCKKLDELLMCAPDPAAQSKHLATKSWLEGVERTWREKILRNSYWKTARHELKNGE